MMHRTLQASKVDMTDRYKLQSRLFDYRESFYGLDLDRPKPEQLLPVFEFVLGLTPHESDNFRELHEAAIAS